MEIRKNISVDFGRDTDPITVFAKQNDKKTRYLSITPLNCGQKFELENGMSAILRLTKPDGRTVVNSAEIDDGIIKIELSEQILSVSGIAVAEIAVYNDEALLSSQNFYINIKKSAYDENAPVSSNG